MFSSCSKSCLYVVLNFHKSPLLHIILLIPLQSHYTPIIHKLQLISFTTHRSVSSVSSSTKQIPYCPDECGYPTCPSGSRIFYQFGPISSFHSYLSSTKPPYQVWQKTAKCATYATYIIPFSVNTSRRQFKFSLSDLITIIKRISPTLPQWEFYRQQSTIYHHLMSW